MFTHHNEHAPLKPVIYCFPCVVYIAAVILLVRAHLCENLTVGEFWSFDSRYLLDLSAWWKSRLVVLTTLCAFCIFLWRVVTGSFIIKKTILYIPMAVYTIAVMLSFLFSHYKKTAWSGANDRYEGTYILVCYMFMLFYTINTIDTRGGLKFVLTAVIISQLILQIIGIAQFTGHNPFQSVIGQKAVIPDYTIDETTGYTLWKEIDELAKQTPPRSLIVNPGNNIYQTVYSFNYLSFYLCVIIPVFVMLCILCTNIRQKIGMAVMLLLTFINLCAANASGGFLGLFIAFVAAVITFRKYLGKWRYQLLMVIMLSGVSVVLTNLYMKYTNQETVSKQIGGQISGSVSRDKPKDKIDYFINNKDSIIASVNGSEITIKINNSKSYLIDAITDNKGNQLKLVFSNDMISSGGIAYKSLAISFTDKRFADLAVFIPALTGTLEGKRMCIIKLKNEKKGWPFFVNQDGTYYLTDRGALVTLRKVPHWGFNNRYDFGTGRGYIWSRTFPLMLNTLLLGHGADTFAMYFPQDDFTGLYYDYNWHSETTPIIDKPHNFILLNFVNTGGVSALALVAMICIYIIQSYKIYTKVIFYDLFSKAGSGIYLGIIAFFIAGMVYDTSVNVMPLIYGLLGIGIACNCIIQNRPEVSNLSIYTI